MRTSPNKSIIKSIFILSVFILLNGYSAMGENIDSSAPVLTPSKIIDQKNDPIPPVYDESQQAPNNTLSSTIEETTKEKSPVVSPIPLSSSSITPKQNLIDHNLLNKSTTPEKPVDLSILSDKNQNTSIISDIHPAVNETVIPISSETNPTANALIPPISKNVISINKKDQNQELNRLDLLKKESIISVDFPDEEVRVIIRNVADLYDLNVVIPNNLEGRASIRLRDVSWDQVYRSVLEPIGYTFVTDGNIVKIRKISDVEKDPLKTELVSLSYITAEDLAKDLTGFIDVSAKESIIPHARSNVLIVTARGNKIENIKKTIAALDIKELQVMIEAKWMEIDRTDADNRGIDQTSFFNGATRSADTFTHSSTLDGLSWNVNKWKLTHNTTSVLSLPDYNALLFFYQNNQKTKIINNPTVITMNNTPATINIGQDVPIPKFEFNSTTGRTNINGYDYRPVGVLLKVTPKAKDNLIMMNIQPETSETDDSISLDLSSSSTAKDQNSKVYGFKSKKVESNVTIESGYTVAIGGLIDRKIVDEHPRLPVLGDLPGIGYLFGAKKKSVDTKDLVIFITATTIGYDGKIMSQQKPDVLNIDPRQLENIEINKTDLPSYKIPEEQKKKFDQLQNMKQEAIEKAYDKKLDDQLNPPKEQTPRKRRGRSTSST